MPDTIKKIAYTFLIGDLFHYGHLRILKSASEKSDYHICGIITDKVAAQWESVIVCDYHERSKVIESLDCVDEIVEQHTKDPTENLRAIHERFPEANILLFQSHQKWGNMPAVDFIKSIGGEVIVPEYYPKLSRDNIFNSFLKGYNQTPDRLGDVGIQNEESLLSTKADTLANLRIILKSAKIEDLVIFRVSEWKNYQKKILEEIENRFLGGKIVIRSSSQNEDLKDKSNAGYYRSFLNIDSGNVDQVIAKVKEIIEDYLEKDEDYEKNQILIQRQTEKVKISGVVFTRNPRKNTPYYLINYDEETSNTDTVTSGQVGTKIEILRSLQFDQIPLKWRSLIKTIRELEEIFSGIVLDIEFAIDGVGEVVIFQVRSLAANRKYLSPHDEDVFAKVDSLAKRFDLLQGSGDYKAIPCFLSDMSFWNPAEIIGDRPNYLDYSLYNQLILKGNWNESLISLGYSKVKGGLMVLLGNKPYIKVRESFLCLTPEIIPSEIKIKLLGYYNSKLRSNPHLHDKIEFEVVLNCYDFNFDGKIEELLEAGLEKAEIGIIRDELKGITNSLLENFDKIVERDLNSIRQLTTSRESYVKNIRKANQREKLVVISQLIEDCVQNGTNQFSRMARFAFVAKKLLLSIKEKDPENMHWYDQFFGQIETVATDFEVAFKDVSQDVSLMDEFMDRFGHLRPGTYDITQRPYQKNLGYFRVFNGKSRDTDLDVLALKVDSVEFDESKRCNFISDLCKVHGIDITGVKLLKFIVEATKMREYFKFEFTKNLSLAIELIAEVGEHFGFAREDMAYLDFDVIALGKSNIHEFDLQNIWRNIINSRKKEQSQFGLLSLPPLVFSRSDLALVQSYIIQPNFISEKNVECELVYLENDRGEQVKDLRGKIIVLEKADPGHDWIFTHGIAGLITKYGGAASHMAIRCAEFDLPAVIGCGDVIFEKAKMSNWVRLDCSRQNVEFFEI